MGGAQVAVEIRGLDADLFILLETACRRLHDGEGFGQHLVENLFYLLVDGLYQFVEFGRQLLLARDLHLGIGELLADLRHFLLFRRRIGTDFRPQRCALGSQVVIGQGIDALVLCQDELERGRQLLQVAVRLGTE